MKLYLNVSLFIFVVPLEILERMGRPRFFAVYYKTDDKIAALIPEDMRSESNFDVPESIYNGKWKGLRMYGSDFGRRLCRDMGWQWSKEQMEVEARFTKDGGLVLRLDQAKASAEKINGRDYLLPQCQYEEAGREDEDAAEDNTDEELEEE